MKKILFSMLACLCAFSCVAAIITISPVWADVAKKKLRYAVPVPKGIPLSDADEFFAKRVKELSKGKINIELYWNRALGKQKEMLPLIKAGVIDFAVLESGQYAETPLVGIGNSLPMTYFNAETVTRVSRDLYKDSKPVKDELKRIGAKIILVRHMPNYRIICREPIRKMSDFKGKKIRSYGAYVPLMWKAVGANPINIVAQEIYDGLAKGLIDCAYLPPMFLNIFKFYEPAKYLIDMDLGMIEYAPTLVPTVVWDRWSDDLKEIILQAARETETFALKHIEKDSTSQIADMISKGAVLVKFEEKEAFKAAVPDMLAEWQKRQSSQGRDKEGAAVVELVRKLKQK